MKVKLPPLTELITEGFRLYVKSFNTVIVLAFIMSFTTSIPNFIRLMQIETPVVLDMMLSIASVIIALVMHAAVTYQIHSVKAGQTLEWPQLVLVLRKRYLNYIVVIVTYELLAFLGLLLFVVPGIIVMLLFFLAPYYAILDNQPNLAAFKSSFSVVKNNPIQIIGFMVCSLLIWGVLLIFVAIIAAIPFILFGVVFHLIPSMPFGNEIPSSILLLANVALFIASGVLGSLFSCFMVVLYSYLKKPDVAVDPDKIEVLA